MIRRDSYLTRIRPFINTDVVKILTGIRRCGKSVMLELIRDELKQSGATDDQFISINFEEMSNSHLLTAASLHAFVETRLDAVKADGQNVYLFFDEIQEVQDWERAINSLRTKSGIDIYLTGSNSRMLSGELASQLTGRYVEFTIYPFSFKEFLTARAVETPLTTQFNDYLALGGMPFLAAVNFDRSASRQYLQELFSSILLKDIVSRNAIRNTDQLSRVIEFALENIGRSFSANSVSDYFKSEKRQVATETVLNYLGYCQDAFLLYKSRRNDLVGKKLLTINEKYYCADHGLRQAVLGGDDSDIGAVLENVVYLELLRRDFNVTIGKLADREVDFVAEKDGATTYVQVSYLLASADTIEREFGVLRDIKDNHPKLVLSMDEVNMSRGGIVHQNIRDFLLS
jgi:predicted AAA+ superfamily ATPase